MLFGEFNGVFKRDVVGEVDAGFFFDGFSHGNPAEGFGEIDFDVAPLDFVFATNLLGEVFEESFRPFSHGLEVAISLIELNSREFGVMADVDAFVKALS